MTVILFCSVIICLIAKASQTPSSHSALVFILRDKPEQGHYAMIGIVDEVIRLHVLRYLGCQQGTSGISRIDRFDVSNFTTHFAGEIKELDIEGFVSKKNARRLDDVIKYTLVSGKQVLTVLIDIISLFSTCTDHQLSTILGSSKSIPCRRILCRLTACNLDL